MAAPRPLAAVTDLAPTKSRHAVTPSLVQPRRTTAVTYSRLWRPDPRSRPQRAKWEIVDSGLAVYWPELDEEIGLGGMLGISESFLEEAAGSTAYDAEPSQR